MRREKPSAVENTFACWPVTCLQRESKVPVHGEYCIAAFLIYLFTSRPIYRTGTKMMMPQQKSCKCYTYQVATVWIWYLAVLKFTLFPLQTHYFRKQNCNLKQSSLAWKDCMMNLKSKLKSTAVAFNRGSIIRSSCKTECSWEA